MATTTLGQMNQSYLSNLISRAESKHSASRKKNTITNIAFDMTLDLRRSIARDSFQFRTQTASLRMTVEKMQGALQRSGQLSVVPLRGSGLQATQVQLPPPSQRDVDEAVAAAGGREALEPWLVDGKTKIQFDGRRTVVDLGASGATGNGDARQSAVASLARFGLDASLLDGDLGTLRDTLKSAAAGFATENANLSLAIEYALEDAYAKISDFEGAKSGAEPAPGGEGQLETNMRQARQVAEQLGLGDGDAWGVESLAQDLAVFGMDLTAVSRDPAELAREIKNTSIEMLADLDKRYVGTEADYQTARRRITGASARLVNGLEGAGGSLIRASMTVNASFSSSQVSVNVDGVKVDANAIIAIGNVIVDPLVLDLAGDGIDLKGADEGVDFDMNGSGEKSRMGFIRGDDALLFVDEYGDGLVRDGRQLFGNADGHANGFEKLRAYDDNGDGVIDENDAVYDRLRVWVEKNEDGVCEAGETMSLREAGVQSIAVGYQNVREDDGKGNLIGQTGSFTRTDGSEGLAADVWLQEKAGS